MRNSLWYKRIPTLLGIFLLAIGIATVTWLINSGTFFETRATPTYTPQQIRISNLSDTSFTVSYTTAEPVLGTLRVGTTPEGDGVALDDRDQQSGTPQAYSVHHITVKNLEPQTTYYFSILSADTVFLDGDTAFNVETLSPVTTQPSQQQPIVGKIALSDGSTNENVLIYLVSDDTQVLSVLPKQDGSFILPLNAVRTKNNVTYATFTPQTIIKLFATSGATASNVTVLTSQINPVPQITLGNNFDFTLNEAPLNASPSATSPTDTESFPSFSATEVNEDEPRIETPIEDEAFSDQQPSFGGTALPGEDVEILIQSNHEIQTTIQANNDGTWSYRPDTKLEPGEHTITVKTRTSEGIIKTIQRQFTVFAEGSQFIEPSVSPQAPTPTISIAADPTITPTPTIEPTATPTATPTLAFSPAPSTTIVPPPGDPGSSALQILGIMASITIGGGIFIFFMTKGKAI